MKLDCNQKFEISEENRSHKINIYIEIDGVILRNPNNLSWRASWDVAPHAVEFLEWALSNHNPEWLTGRDMEGTGEGVTEALMKANGCSARLLRVASLIPSIFFYLQKTGFIDFSTPFIWIDRNPNPRDLRNLERKNCLDRCLVIDTNEHPNDLLYASAHIKANINTLRCRPISIDGNSTGIQ